jgi:glutathione S-transferase
MSTEYRLISFKLCPYTQRTVIALEQKQAPYSIEHIDQYNKPDWFLDLSPLGKVPILRVGDAVIFESAVINEYIEETSPGPPLHPTDPLRRAHNRAWIEVASDLNRKIHGVINGANEASTRQAATRARGILARFDDELGDGPLFNGQDMSLVDAAIAPPLQRLSWCEEVEPSLDLFSATPKVKAWRDALLELPSVKRSTVPEICEIFAEHLKGRGTPSRNVEPSWLGKRG